MAQDTENNKTGQRLTRWLVLDYTLGVAAIVILACMVLLTCIDVVARYWFNSPVNGAFELTQMLLAGLIFISLPMTTASGEHVDVELLTSALGQRVEKYFLMFGHVVSAIVLFALSWRLWLHADRLAHDGAVTNSLSLPFAPIGYLAAVSCALSGVIVLAGRNRG